MTTFFFFYESKQQVISCFWYVRIWPNNSSCQSYYKVRTVQLCVMLSKQNRNQIQDWCILFMKGPGLYVQLMILESQNSRNTIPWTLALKWRGQKHKAKLDNVIQPSQLGIQLNLKVHYITVINANSNLIMNMKTVNKDNFKRNGYATVLWKTVKESI